MHGRRQQQQQNNSPEGSQLFLGATAIAIGAGLIAYLAGSGRGSAAESCKRAEKEREEVCGNKKKSGRMDSNPNAVLDSVIKEKIHIGSREKKENVEIIQEVKKSLRSTP